MITLDDIEQCRETVRNAACTHAVLVAIRGALEQVGSSRLSARDRRAVYGALELIGKVVET